MILQTTLSPTIFKNILQSWGPEKTQIFLQHYWLDYLHPIFYSNFMASVLVSMQSKLFGLAFVAGISDVLENTMHIFLLQGIIRFDSNWFYLGGGFALLKWLFVIICIALMVWKLAQRGFDFYQ